MAMAEALADSVPDGARELMARHWPGPADPRAEGGGARPRHAHRGNGHARDADAGPSRRSRARARRRGGRHRAERQPERRGAADDRRCRCAGISPMASTPSSTAVPTAGGMASTVADCTVWPPRVLRPGPVSGMRVTGVVQAGGKNTRMGGRPEGAPRARTGAGSSTASSMSSAPSPMRSCSSPTLRSSTPPSACRWCPTCSPTTARSAASTPGSGRRPATAAFTVACDMPFLMPEVARLVIDRAALADVVVPECGGRYETLHACYAKSCLGPDRGPAPRRGSSRSRTSSATCACSPSVRTRWPACAPPRSPS